MKVAVTIENGHDYRFYGHMEYRTGKPGSVLKTIAAIRNLFPGRKLVFNPEILDVRTDEFHYP